MSAAYSQLRWTFHRLAIALQRHCALHIALSANLARYGEIGRLY